MFETSKTDHGTCWDCLFAAGAPYRPLEAGGDLSAHRTGAGRVRAGAVIVRGGTTPGTVHVLRDGWAFRYAVLESGKRQILNFLVPGDLFDLDSLILPSGTAIFSTQALTPLSYCRFETNAFRKLMHSSEERARAFNDQLAAHLTCKARQLSALGQQRALARLAMLILSLHHRLQLRQLAINGAFDFPPRQEHLADALGMTTEHVNRTLTTLRNDGIITQDGRTLQILDIDKLRSIAAH